MQRRPPRGKPEPRPSPVVSMLADQFAAKPWPVGRGERLVAGPPPPQPPPAPSLTIPPVDWEQELRERGEQADPGPSKTAGTAIESMMSNAVALGEAEWPQLDLRPPAVLEPLHPVKIPEPSWREELANAEARDERDRLTNAAKLLGVEPAPKPTYPATKRTALPVSEPEPGPASSLRVTFPKPDWSEA